MRRVWRRARAAALAVLLLPMAGCLREEIVQPVRASVAVHAMAVVGSTTFGLTLSRVSIAFIEEPITGASVRLIRDDGTTELVQSGNTSALCFAPLPEEFGEEPRDAECYAAVLDTPIRPHETIGLEIELPDGTTIAGSTTTPGPVDFVTPTAEQAIDATFFIDDEEFGYSVSVMPIEVHWLDPHDRPANVYFEIRRVFEDGVAREPNECERGDRWFQELFQRSPARLHPPGTCGFFDVDLTAMWDSMHVDLHVAAYDESFARYAAAVYEDGTGVIVDHAAVGIDVVAGDEIVAGVFGSAASSVIPLTLHATVVDRRTNGSRASARPAPSAAAP